MINNNRFCDTHNFTKPNDIRGIKLMNLAALNVVDTFNEIFLAYGQSDEYSFVFRREANVYNRRSEKILTCKNKFKYFLIINTDVVSAFTSAYVFNWNKCFKDVELKYPPTFDGRIILYPTLTNLRDYFSWRQVDCHINNLYNTTFWALVLIGKLTKEEANNRLKGTFAKDKNEILFKDYMINYNSIEEIYKRGTIIVREIVKKIKNPKIKVKKKEQIVDDVNIKIEDLQIVEEEKESWEPKMKWDLVDKLLTQDNNYCEILKNYFSQNIFLSHEDMIVEDFWKRFELS
jgi:tRNA(His) guanylyltransferase